MIGNYSKAIVALAVAVGQVLQTAYPGSPWAQAVTAAIGAALVYIVPNTSAEKPPAPPTPIIKPVPPANVGGPVA